MIPLLQRSRIRKLLNGSKPLDKVIQQLPTFKRMLSAANKTTKISDEVITISTEAKQAWAKLLTQSIDGRDLTFPDIDADSNIWMKQPDRVFPRFHLRAIQLHGGTLSTKSRGSCGRNLCEQDVQCRGACHATETLNHNLQICEITHDGRCARHNCVMKEIEGILRKNSTKTWMEPIIPTQKSFIKLDLVMEKGRTTHIIDVSIVVAHRMEESWALKTRKYSSSEKNVWTI